MSIQPIHIVFEMDGTGVCFDPASPIHLDGLLAYALAPLHTPKDEPPPARDETPAEIPLPLDKWRRDGQWGWCASAVLPDSESATIRYWRKKFRTKRAGLYRGTANLSSGPTREWNIPIELILCRKMEAWAVGDRRRVEQVLRRNIRYLGHKRAHGHGRVIGVTVTPADEDYSLARDGFAMRYLPDPSGIRKIRPRPPYWNIVGAVPSLYVGDPVP